MGQGSVRVGGCWFEGDDGSWKPHGGNLGRPGVQMAAGAARLPDTEGFSCHWS